METIFDTFFGETQNVNFAEPLEKFFKITKNSIISKPFFKNAGNIKMYLSKKFREIEIQKFYKNFIKVF